MAAGTQPGAPDLTVEREDYFQQLPRIEVTSSSRRGAAESGARS